MTTEHTTTIDAHVSFVMHENKPVTLLIKDWHRVHEDTQAVHDALLDLTDYKITSTRIATYQGHEHFHLTLETKPAPWGQKPQVRSRLENRLNELVQRHDKPQFFLEMLSDDVSENALWVLCQSLGATQEAVLKAARTLLRESGWEVAFAQQIEDLYSVRPTWVQADGKRYVVLSTCLDANPVVFYAAVSLLYLFEVNVTKIDVEKGRIFFT